MFAILKSNDSLLLSELLDANTTNCVSFHPSCIESLYLQIQLLEGKFAIELLIYSLLILRIASPNVRDLPAAKVHGKDYMSKHKNNHV